MEYYLYTRGKQHLHSLLFLMATEKVRHVRDEILALLCNASQLRFRKNPTL